jgi:hypothetical protein
MFVGHYAAAFAAKAAEPKAPLWALAAGCQLVDIGWGALLIAGVEHAHLDQSLPGYPAVLEYMPFTHSLPGALLWALGALLLAKLLLRVSWRISGLIGAVVFSHWLLDLVVHRPDLELWFGGEKVGLALWNYPVPEQAVEMGLIAITGAAWAASRAKLGRSVWPALVLIGFYVALQIAAMLAPLSNDPVSMGGSALAAYAVATIAAAVADRGGPRPRSM